MKRLASLLLVAILVVTMVPASLLAAFALETTTVSVNVPEEVYSIGDTFQATISLDTADGIEAVAGYQIVLKWDSAVLALEGDIVVESTGESAVNAAEGTVVVSNPTDVISSGTLFVATFKALAETDGTAIAAEVQSMGTASGLIAAEGGSATVKVAAPVPNHQVTVNVNDNAILTDGETDIVGSWASGVSNGKVVNVMNGSCTTVGMDVTVLYALGETKSIDGVTVYLYHSAESMIGYPEGKATVLVSTDGTEYISVGEFDLVAPDYANASTVKNEFKFDAVDAAYVKVLLYAGSNEAVRGDAAWDGKVNWEFISLSEVAVSEAPVSNFQATVNVNDNAILTDGETDIVGSWASGISYGKVVNVMNGSCTTVGMDVTVLYALGETKSIDGVTVYLYHSAESMIGYPEGKATVLVSTDGTEYISVGEFDLVAPDYANASTVKNEFKFDAVDAAYVKVLLYAGSNEAVRGDAAWDGKVNWEFISLSEVAVSEAIDVHEHTYTEEVTAKATLSAEGVKTYTCECGDSYTESIPAVKAQPDELVTLPEGAYGIDYAGYKHAGVFSLVAGDNMTVAELTALGNNGAAKDMNYAYIVVVDANGIVTQVDFTLSVGKSDVVCPAGGYIISYNGNKEGYTALENVKVGDIVTLYNIDLASMRGIEGNVQVENAGFTFKTPENAKVEKPVTSKGEDGIVDITDRWSNGNATAENITLVQNPNCTEAGMDVTLSLDLGETKTIDGVSLSLYHDAGSMIGYPEGQATVLVSTDGETWTEIGKFDLTAAELSKDAAGTVTSEFKFEEAVEAAYVKVLVTVGSNEAVRGEENWGGKNNWEFIGVTNLAVSEVKVGLAGDVDNDGSVTLQDYMLLRLAILQKVELDEDEAARADVVADSEITLQDAMLIRVVILGTVIL